MKILASLIAAFALFSNSSLADNSTVSATCTNFTVGPGTGCAWMCNYCANTLGTSNYYFTTGVCTYETGGCVGNPQEGVVYTCCAA